MTGEDVSGDYVYEVPQVMPSNNWWDLASQAITSAKDVALARINSGTRAAPKGVIAGNSSNPPPGSMGTMPQANSSPGGAIDQQKQLAKLVQSVPDWVWGLGAVVLAFGVIALVRRS